MVVRLASCDAVTSTTEIPELWFPVLLTFARRIRAHRRNSRACNVSQRVKALELTGEFSDVRDPEVLASLNQSRTADAFASTTPKVKMRRPARCIDRRSSTSSVPQRAVHYPSTTGTIPNYVSAAESRDPRKPLPPQ